MPDSSRMPLVSIVIPVYNGADYLAEAIDSALAQSWPNVEVIVVNDGSTDGGRTEAIAARYGDRIRYESKPNGGVSTAVNHGIRCMRGTYFSWLSHDDVYLPEKIERQMAVLLPRNEPAIAFGDYELMDAAGNTQRTVHVGEHVDPHKPLWALLEGRINGCTILVHRACFEHCGLFHPGLPTTQDYDLWFRIGLRFPLVHVPGVTVRHRKHPGQGSRIERHLDEVTLLWMSMLDRMPEKTALELAPTPSAFLDRLLRSPVVQSSAALRTVIERERWALIADRTVALAVHRPVGWGAALATPRIAASAGLTLSNIVMCHGESDEWRSICLERDDRTTLRIDRTYASGDEQTDLLALLRCCSEHSQSEFVWLGGELPFMPEAATDCILALAGQPLASACLLSPIHTGPSAGPGAILEGAVFRRQALSEAVKACTGGLTSLIHALTRVGPIIATERPLASPSSIPPAAEAVPDVVQPPEALTLAARLVAFLVRRRALAAPAWRTLRLMLGEDAGRQLARWAGIEGRFDANWYRQAYPDVAMAGFDPVFHYLTYGHREGRDPSAHFSTSAYLDAFPDVDACRINPLQHYAIWGVREGRMATPSSLGLEPLNADDERPTVLFVLHSLGGGVARFASDLASQIAPRLRGLFLCGKGNGEAVLGLDERGEIGRTLRIPEQIDTLAQYADALDVRRVVVLHCAGFAGHLPAVLEGLSRPVDVVNLDYMLVAQQPHLADAQGRFVGDDALPPPVWSHDPQRRWLVENGERFFACSDDLKRRLQRLGLPREVIAAPPPDPSRLRAFRPWARPIRDGEPLRIALFATIVAHKGWAVLIDVLERVKADNLPLRFLILGRILPPVPDALRSLIRTVEAPEGKSPTNAVACSNPHLAWFPFQVPETHSYAVTDAIANGLPIAAGAIGAVTERLRSRPLTWLLPWDAPAEEWLALFLRLHRDGMPTEDAPREPEASWAADADLYQRYIYDAVFSDDQCTASHTQGESELVRTTR